MAAPGFENLLLEVADGVATLTFNRPKALNALNEATLRDLRNALTWIEHHAAGRMRRGFGPHVGRSAHAVVGQQAVRVGEAAVREGVLRVFGEGALEERLQDPADARCRAACLARGRRRLSGVRMNRDGWPAWVR